MRQCRRGWAAAAVVLGLLGVPGVCRASSCTTQAELQPQDRSALAAASGRLLTAVLMQDDSTLQSSLLPSEAGEWDGIKEAVDIAGPLVKGGQAQLRSLYLLDATSLTAPADTQFFCSDASNTLTVTITMRALPPGKYAVVLADAAGAPLAGQVGMILAWDANAWKLAGLTIRPGMLGGHDGVWYWTQARQLARMNQPWPAFYTYEIARLLLLPVDFLSSPNLDKLGQEESLIKNSPAEVFPYSLVEGDRAWKIDAVRPDPSLREADLGVSYESTGVTDAAAKQTEAIAVMSALLKAQPGLRESFHGLWAYAVNNGKITPVLELPMAKIP